MNISFFMTSQLSQRNWDTYAESFNHVFKKLFSPDIFKKKYQSCTNNESYHGFIMEGETIVGGCTAIPYTYSFFESDYKFALIVDAFVHENYRKYEFALIESYLIVKQKLIEDSISFIISFPNSNAYPLWKKLADWKDVGILPWYVLPVRLGSLLRKSRLLNISFIPVYLYSAWNYLFTLFSGKKLQANIFISENLLEISRFSDLKYHKIDNSSFIYNMVVENGINTAYLLNYNHFSKHDLSIAIIYILKKDRPDIIIFVGTMNSFQTSFIKLPKKYHPREFHFCAYALQENFSDHRLYDLDNWDLSLSNFDVR